MRLARIRANTVKKDKKVPGLETRKFTFALMSSIREKSQAQLNFDLSKHCITTTTEVGVCSMHFKLLPTLQFNNFCSLVPQPQPPKFVSL